MSILHTPDIHIISVHNYQIRHAKYAIIPILSKLYHYNHVSMPQHTIIKILLLLLGFLFVLFVFLWVF